MRKVFFLLVCLAVTLSGGAQRLPRTSSPRHYALDLNPDIATGKLSGHEVIEIEVLQPTTSISLNSVGLHFERVELTSGKSRQIAQVSLDEPKEMATLAFDKQIPAGPATLDIAYSGILREDLRGLYLSKTARRKYPVTQFEGTYARMMFPGFDEPEYKATFDLSVVADKGDTAISNGVIVEDRPGPGDGKHTIRFATSPKMSSYLVALAIGDWQCSEGRSDGVPIRICALPEKKDLTVFALHAAESFLHFYNQYYGIKYPFGKLDMVAIPDYEWGGMENTASVFYKERALLIDPKTATLETRRGVAGVVAHEMAHQWFGDLVTMKWWDNVWLNEGFATWMTPKALHSWDPGWDPNVEEAQSKASVLRVDRLQSTRSIRANAETPAEIKELFDGITYAKGAAILRMIESYVGEEIFRDGVNAYLHKYANGSATAEDFWTEIARVSGKPIDHIMAGFIDQAGAPLVSSSATCSNGITQVELSQERFTSNPERTGEKPAVPQTWNIPVCLRGLDRDAQARCEVMTEPKQLFRVSGCGTEVFLNSGAHGYYRSSYPPETLHKIAAKAEVVLTPAERLVLLDDQWALVLAGRAGVGDFLTLAQGFGKDRNGAVLQSMIGSLQTINSTLADSQTRERYQTWMRNLIAPAAKEVGYEVGYKDKPSDSDQTKELRVYLFRVMTGTGDPEAIQRARQLAQRFLSDPASVDLGLAETGLNVVARDGSAALYESLLEKTKTAPTPELYFRYLLALTHFSDPVLVRRNIELLKSPSMREQDLGRFLSDLLSNPASREQAWAFMTTDWDVLKTKVVGFGGAGPVDALGSYCDAGSRDEIVKFFQSHRAPGAERTLKRSIERINNCIDLKRLQQKKFVEWLNAQG